MQIETDLKLDFDDVLIRPKRSTLDTRKEVDLYRSYTGLHSKYNWTGIPAVVSNMDTTGTFAMTKSLSKLGLVTALHKFYTTEQLVKETYNLESNRYFYTMGISDSEIEKLKNISDNITTYLQHEPTELDLNYVNYFPYMINIDVANGYTSNFHKKVKEIRKIKPLSFIMAGNVATPEMTQQLLECGADVVKAGIGPGSVCETRIKTGVGYPQLSAIIECADAAHGYGGLLCADGGCKNPGDICKAFGAGADFVMVGGMFAGTEECEGEWETKFIPHFPAKKKALKFYGMSSKEAQIKHNGGLSSHRTSEGKCVLIPYKGYAEDVALDILGGLRSACTYVGAKRLKDFSKCCTFVRCNNTHNRIYG